MNEALDFPSWLDEDGRRVFAATRLRVKDPTPDQLEMLAAYAHAMANLRRVRNDPKRAKVWRSAMLFCRNGLGFGGLIFVDLIELICDSGLVDEPDVVFYLKPEWQLSEEERPEDYKTRSSIF